MDVEYHDPEWARYNELVREAPDRYEHWEGLIRTTEALEGGVSRSTSPQSHDTLRSVYDRFLARFPLFFGYWKKYADITFAVSGSEDTERIYERGTASCRSVDLWACYVSFKMETSHDPSEVRALFERGAEQIGLDFLAHTFWDKYLEYEERLESPERIFGILQRIIHIPLHQYARYFERFTLAAQVRPLSELLPADVLASFRKELLQEPVESIKAGTQQIKLERGELEIERELRIRVHNLHLEVFHATQAGVTRRWPYESEIKRPYFHTTELLHEEIVAWRKYLDFEELEGDLSRIIFLYERCLVACALYDEFWLRYARWMSAQFGRQEDVRNIYLRAASTFVPVGRPFLRYHFATWEEAQGRPDVARDIYDSILEVLTGHAETTIYLANLERRLDTKSTDAAVAIYREAIASDQYDVYAKGSIMAEWVNLIWKLENNVALARELFATYRDQFLDSRYFFIQYFRFELDQPLHEEQHQRIADLYDFIMTATRLPPLTLKDISHSYMHYLFTRGPEGALELYLRLDIEVNGPFSVRTRDKIRNAEDGKLASSEHELRIRNGHPGVRVEQPLAITAAGPAKRGMFDEELELQRSLGLSL
jgi:pre-mRNA-processing factor 39